MSADFPSPAADRMSRRISCTWCGIIAEVRTIPLGNVTEWLQLPPGWFTLVDCGSIEIHVCCEDHARKYRPAGSNVEAMRR